jgi:phosphatidylglycerol:prolipoprotein diacylglycerol transferase
VPVQPAAGYELLLNLALIALLLVVARRSRQPGMLLTTYLFSYTVTQFLVFFARANLVVSLGPLAWGLKQAQWTSLIVFLLLIPLTLWVWRWHYAEAIPAGEVPATVGIPQKSSRPVEANEPAAITAEQGEKRETK